MTASDNSITIQIDGRPFNVPSHLSGSQIKALVQKDFQYQLFVEAGGKSSDQAVSDEQSFRLLDGMKFYTVPPAAFGNG